MKRTVCLCLALLLLLGCMPVFAADDGDSFDAKVDYLSLMLESAMIGTPEALVQGARYEVLRNQKIVALDSRYATTSFFSSYESALEIENAIRVYQKIDPRTESDVAAQSANEIAASNLVYVVDADLLNCRLSPSLSASVVARFTRGTRISGLGEVTGSFAHIRCGNITGWCSVQYLRESTAAPPMDYTDKDLEWLALVIHREAGASWASDQLQLMVGNVVMNRVASPEFPDTIEGVLTQRGQYPWSTRDPYAAGTPSARCYANARRLLNGERFCPANVVFQAEFRQGSGVHLEIYDEILGTTTYFCYR